MSCELLGDSVDSFGHDQHWAVHRLCQKVAERPVETAREHHPLTLRDKRERAVDPQNGVHVTGE